MGQAFSSITAEIEEFIRTQQIFFVATAPLSGEGHVNLSPKGLDSFRILSPTRVGYLDLTGSGNETACHVTENGRLTLMFCAFEGKPNILRLYGRGSVVLPGSSQWTSLAANFTLFPGTRQIVVCDVQRVQTSCGMGIPIMRFESTRQALVEWASRKGEEGMAEYRRKKNGKSIDGILAPGISIYGRRWHRRKARGYHPRLNI